MSNRHPVQPLVIDQHGRLRLHRNAIVEYLLDHGSVDMNKLAMLGFAPGEREHFAQLIGYSLDGLAELSYVTQETLDRVCEGIPAAEAKAAPRHPRQPLDVDDFGFVRFKENGIVSHLSSQGGVTMADLEAQPFDAAEWEHFWQLMGTRIDEFAASKHASRALVQEVEAEIAAKFPDFLE